MTEKEKRDSGLIYNPNYDQELLAEMDAAAEVCFRYNSLPPKVQEEVMAFIEFKVAQQSEKK